jgi:hypothetical protein
LFPWFHLWLVSSTVRKVKVIEIDSRELDSRVSGK